MESVFSFEVDMPKSESTASVFSHGEATLKVKPEGKTLFFSKNRVSSLPDKPKVAKITFFNSHSDEP